MKERATIYTLTLTAIFLAMCLAIKADEATKALGRRKAEDVKPIAGYTPKGEGDKDEKTIDADVLNVKRIVIKSKDGKASIAIQQAEGGMVGIWVTDKSGSVCIVAGGPGDGAAYMGVMPKDNKAMGCPIAITSDGTVQIATAKAIKHIGVDTLMRLAR